MEIDNSAEIVRTTISTLDVELGLRLYPNCG